MAVDAAYIYWTNGNGTIGRANLDGTDINQKFITGANFACGLVVNSGGQPPHAVVLPSPPVTTPAPRGDPSAGGNQAIEHLPTHDHG